MSNQVWKTVINFWVGQKCVLWGHSHLDLWQPRSNQTTPKHTASSHGYCWLRNIKKKGETRMHHVFFNNISHPSLAMFYYALHSWSVSHQWFVGALEDIADKVAAPSFHCLPANKAKVIHVTNTLERKDHVVWGFSIGFKITHKPKQTIACRNTGLHTCEQKEISLKLFSMATFLVSGLTKKTWDRPT